MANPVTSVATTSSTNTTPSPCNIITLDDVNALKLLMACRRGGPVAKSFALVFKQLSKLNPGTKIADHCVQYYLLNPEKRNVFKNKEDSMNLQTTQPQDLDVTMLHKLLRNVCDIDSIKDNLQLLKSHRNFLAHDVVQLSDKDLIDRFGQIETQLKAILRKINIDSSTLIDELQKILTTSTQRVQIREMKDQQRGMKELREDIERGVIEDCSNELRDRYSKMRVMTPITWLEHPTLHNITVDKVFTELTIFKTTTRVAVKEVLEVKQEAGKASNRIIITGVTGAGKTSLCRYLMYCWGEGPAEVDKIEGLDQVKLLIFIQCRFVQSDDLISYLREDILHDSLHHLWGSEVISLLKRVNPLFLVDGYEEANETTMKVIEQIHTLFRESKMIVSSRPHIVSDLKAKLAFDSSQVHETLTLQIEGLDKENVIEFARKLFGVLETQPVSQNSFISLVNSKEWDKLQGILKLPLTLALLILLWVDDESCINEISTEAQIHLKIIEMTKRRLQQRRPNEVSEIDMNQMVEIFCDKLGMVALDAIAGDYQEHLDTDMVKKLENVSPNLSVEMMSALLACETKGSLTTSKKVWSFIHASQQEMLAAMHVKKQTSVDDNYQFWKRLSNSSGCDSEFSSELMRNVILKSMELLASSGELTSEVVGAVAEGFPPNSKQNLGFIGEMLKLCEPIDETVIVESLKEHLNVSQLCKWIGSTHIPIITTLLKKGILPPETKLSFHVVDLDYERFVRDLNDCNCTPLVLIDVSLEDQLAKLLNFLTNNKNDLSLHIVMEFRRSCSEKVLSDLVNKWNWSEPMKISCRDSFAPEPLDKLPGIIGLRLIKIVCEGSGNVEVVKKMKNVSMRNNITFEEINVQDDRMIISFHTQ